MKRDGSATLVQGSRALVIGGSGGIGWAISRRLAAAGANLFVHGARSRRVRDRVSTLRDEFPDTQVDGIPLRVERAEQITKIVAKAGEIDILVVAFGPICYAPLSDTGADEWARIVELNLTMPGIAVSSALPGMIGRRFGRIVLFGGPMGAVVRGYDQIGAYAAAKAGLSTLVKSITREAGDRDIVANVVSPGFVDTEYIDESRRVALLNRLPSGAFLQVTDVASVAMQLIEDARGLIRGQTVCVDAGLDART